VPGASVGDVGQHLQAEPGQVLFRHGAPHIGGTRLGTAAGVAALRAAARACSPAGQLQVAVALESLEQADRRLRQVRRQLAEAARHLAGARELHARLYGVGPVTALALTCWLAGKGRFSSARKAVRFAGLDVTVYSSAGKRAPGHLSRQGPEVLRWCLRRRSAGATRPLTRPRRSHEPAAIRNKEQARSRCKPAHHEPSGQEIPRLRHWTDAGKSLVLERQAAPSGVMRD
jgi:transposase